MNEITQSALSQVDSLIQTALANDDIGPVLQQIHRMTQAKELVGKALAKTLYNLHKHWYSFSISEHESFYGTMDSINLSSTVVKRYLRVAEYIKSFPPQIQEKPIRELIPIANAVSQGYDISDNDWKELERAERLSDIQKYVTTEIKNQEPRKGSLQIYLDSNGSLYCWYNQEQWNIGYLDVECSEIGVRKSIDRIIGKAGVILK